MSIGIAADARRGRWPDCLQCRSCRKHCDIALQGYRVCFVLVEGTARFSTRRPRRTTEKGRNSATRAAHCCFLRELRGSPCSPVRPEGRDHLVGGSPTRAMVGWPGSWQAMRLGNWPYRSPATNLVLGGGANRRAVTCVKPEQASKGKLWTPTRPENGEGSTARGSSRHMHLDSVHRGNGHGTSRQGIAQAGEIRPDEGSGLNGAAGHRSARESDRVVVPSKPGNAGGGKAPDFWCVFEANAVR